jgi:protein-S-isoprenylcysteine O-methyltransferase Ste14
MMNDDLLFRILFVFSGIVMMAIRFYYQKKIISERERTSVKGNPLALIPGGIAALVTIIFSLEYIFVPGTFWFAYLITYPAWLRWIGALLLGAGIVLLGLSHHHLGRSFSSFVALKEDQVFVETGPYRYIRHPIYTSYIMNHIGGGLLAANLVLTIVPVVFFGLMLAFRIREEERMLVAEYGERYRSYMANTGRFLPFF